MEDRLLKAITMDIFDDVARALDFDEKAVQQVISNIDDLRKTLTCPLLSFT